MPFVYEIPVRFADVDGAGILYYPRFLNYFHIAFEEFFERALGVPYPRLIKDERLGFPMVHLEVDFRRPLTYGDAARVEVSVLKVGRTSVEFRYEVKSRKTGEVTTTARGVTVAVNLDSFEPMPVPEPYRTLLVSRIDAP
jgi:4-hydroxybenzoyl-CoA thioesterase